MIQTDEIGLRYGRLVVVDIFPGKSRGRLALCECDCGQKKTAHLGNIKMGKTKSCGCLRSEITRSRVRTHGEPKNSKEYKAWAGMRERCYSKTHGAYDRYGGRGIVMCDRWFNSFEAFLEDMGRAPSPDLSLDRIDVNGNYEPSNCRWATDTVQARNTRRAISIEYLGEKKCMAEWAEVCGVSYKYFFELYKYKNMTIEQIMNKYRPLKDSA